MSLDERIVLFRASMVKFVEYPVKIALKLDTIPRAIKAIETSVFILDLS